MPLWYCQQRCCPQHSRMQGTNNKTKHKNTLCLLLPIPAVIKHDYKNRVKLMDLVTLFYPLTGKRNRTHTHRPSHTYRSLRAFLRGWRRRPRSTEDAHYYSPRYILPKSQRPVPLHSVNSRREYVMAKVYQLMRAMLERTAHITTRRIPCCSPAASSPPQSVTSEHLSSVQRRLEKSPARLKTCRPPPKPSS